MGTVFEVSLYLSSCIWAALDLHLNMTLVFEQYTCIWTLGMNWATVDLHSNTCSWTTAADITPVFQACQVPHIAWPSHLKGATSWPRTTGHNLPKTSSCICKRGQKSCSAKKKVRRLTWKCFVIVTLWHHPPLVAVMSTRPTPVFGQSLHISFSDIVLIWCVE